MSEAADSAELLLRERVKELDALHAAARLVLEPGADVPAVLDGVVALLPPALQHADRASAHARHGGLVRETPGHDHAVARLAVTYRTRHGVDGVVEIGYAAPGGEFLVEERQLIESITDLLRAAIDRLESERELQTTYERLSVAMSSARMGVWEWHIPSNLVYLSEELTRLVGLEGTRTGVLGAFRDLLHPDDYTMALDRLQRMIATGGDTLQLEVRARHADGTWIRIHWLARLTRDNDGTPLRVTAVLSDVTTQRALEERVRQTEKIEALGRVAGGVAHDFNNLLTIMFGACHMLESSFEPDDDRRTLVAELQAAATRGAAITKQLLAFSRRTSSDPREIDLRHVVEQLTPLLSRLVAPGCHIRTRLARDTPSIIADPTQIEQIVLNLVVNARDAMPDGGTIEVGLAPTAVDQAQAARHVGAISGPHVLISVQDHGAGIAPELLARIFEPFFTTKPSGHGTGLGLAVVTSAVRQCHGHVEVASEVGRGTTFRVYMPSAR